MIDHKHHMGQIRKNWGIITMMLATVFGAGVVWSFTERDFVETQTFSTHVEAERKALEVHKDTEKREMDQRFESQNKLIDQKFKNTNDQIKHMDEHIEDQQKTLEEIKDFIMDR